MTWRIDTHELSRIVKHDTVYWQGQKIYIGICNEKKKLHTRNAIREHTRRNCKVTRL